MDGGRSEADRAWPASVNPLRRTDEARSLFGEILDWMFAPLILVWPMSVSLTYLVAQSVASAPFDQALTERAHVLASYVRLDAGRPVFWLPPGAHDLLGLAEADGGSYALRDARGQLLAGDAELPSPSGDQEAAPGQYRLRTETLRGRELRIAYATVPVAARGDSATRVLVQVADPTDGRNHLANEIIKGVMLPQFIVLPLALLLVWFGLTRGLAPLVRLQQTIRRRPPEDLSPIDAEAAPEELSPLLASFNELMARMTHNLEVQKRFIADAAHQMKTPLAGMRTQAELAQRQGDAHELQRSLRQIAASTERATRLVNQLLALARAEHGAGEAGAMVPVDLAGLARAVAQDWVAPAMAQRIDLGFEGPEATGPAVGCEVLGAPGLLRELLNNLIDNALRYTAGHASDIAPGGASDPPLGTTTVRVRREAHEVVLEVEDSGPGVPPEERERVFERFYRVLGSRQEGSGLGLAIVREISIRHRATVNVVDAHADEGASTNTSRQEPAQRGALFRVRFRALRSTAQQAASERRSPG